MFHASKHGVRLEETDLWLDARKAVARSFMSHAHSDHIARHQAVVCTEATGELAAARQGARPGLNLTYREPVDLGPVRVTAYPAGHCLGSAMLLVEDGRRRLLYTGDVRLRPDPTCEPAEVPEADLLIMECTYGDPRYRFPDRAEVAARLVEGVEAAIRRGRVPVLYAYSLGKAQEVEHILSAAGIPVIEHPAVARISAIYERHGVGLGRRRTCPDRPFDRAAFEGCAVVWPPSARRHPALGDLAPITRFFVSGWALTAGEGRRFGSIPVPLSSHADFDELRALVRLADPSEVYVTHGPASFARHLARDGRRAYPLLGPRQLTLF